MANSNGFEDFSGAIDTKSGTIDTDPGIIDTDSGATDTDPGAIDTDRSFSGAELFKNKGLDLPKIFKTIFYIMLLYNYMIFQGQLTPIQGQLTPRKNFQVKLCENKRLGLSVGLPKPFSSKAFHGF